jgi:hypothetical protein
MFNLALIAIEILHCLRKPYIKSNIDNDTTITIKTYIYVYFIIDDNIQKQLK